MWTSFQSNENENMPSCVYVIFMYEIDRNARIEYSPRSRTSEFPPQSLEAVLSVGHKFSWELQYIFNFIHCSDVSRWSKLVFNNDAFILFPTTYPSRAPNCWMRAMISHSGTTKPREWKELRTLPWPVSFRELHYTTTAGVHMQIDTLRYTYTMRHLAKKYFDWSTCSLKHVFQAHVMHAAHCFLHFVKFLRLFFSAIDIIFYGDLTDFCCFRLLVFAKQNSIAYSQVSWILDNHSWLGRGTNLSIKENSDNPVDTC